MLRTHTGAVMLRCMLTRMASAFAILLLAGCSPAGAPSNEQTPANGSPRAATPPPGWSSGRDQDGAYLEYSWGDSSGALFSGLCEGHPVLALFGGDYPARASTFELLVDDQKWELETYEEARGRALFVDVPAIVDRIASAERRIVFRVGSWSRELRPSPLIRTFVDECRAAG